MNKDNRLKRDNGLMRGKRIES